MWRADSLEKTLMLGKIEGKRRGQQRIRWLDSQLRDSPTLSTWTWVNPRWHGGQRSLACCSPWSHRLRHNWTTKWPSNHTPGRISGHNYNSKRCVHLHCTAAPFTVAKTWGQPRCPSTDEWIQIQCIYTVDYYSAIKKNETLSFAATWMDLEIIILSEISQTEKRQTPYDITYMWNLRYDTYKLTSETETGSGT